MQVTEDGKYSLVLVFESKALELSDFEKRQVKLPPLYTCNWPEVQNNTNAVKSTENWKQFRSTSIDSLHLFVCRPNSPPFLDLGLRQKSVSFVHLCIAPEYYQVHILYFTHFLNIIVQMQEKVVMIYMKFVLSQRALRNELWEFMGVCKRKGYCNIDVNGLDRECCPYS
jgi:hypothetical protein